ncbi:hypothetical protein FNV43_RR26364 [Rhamnella rubrinervis]|uniref:Root meristem growth factor 8 n=1 Tax=Rhamnella rubrinervis TaxID=2594499 RepID=A0A8K0DMF4_9ROSA|nr:hypothetical protein FNV43_RR26364 [Rhamnella rubrinervis]
MELVAMTTLMCLALSAALFTPCASLPIDHEVQSSHSQQASEFQVEIPTLSRKLRFTQDLTVVVGREGSDMITSNKEQKENLQGKADDKEHVMMHGNRGTRQELVEVTDPSMFFTMDYSQVKRRPPIHNKSLPFSSP